VNGGFCALTCNDEDFVGGNAACVDGEWVLATCVPLGTLDAQIGDASDGTVINGAVVYIEGFYDPSTEDCEASDYCRVSVGGAVNFDAFPTGPQKIVIVAVGYDEIAIPVEIAPGGEQSVRLDALPTGFLDGNMVILLGWEVRQDFDLVLSVPADGADEAACVYYDATGSLTDAPYAQLDHDTKVRAGGGTETVRVALNEDGTGPAIDGTYSVLVTTGTTFGEANPEVRLIRLGENGAAEVSLFQLPAGSDDDASWHVFDLHGDGTLTDGGTTEPSTDMSELACIDTVYGN
jgi:hypothetical protein